LDILYLTNNPGITARGYGALFDFINRANSIRDGQHSSFCVDDKAWEGELNLVHEMNSKYGRLEYMTNGTFTSKECRLQWLERVANLPSSGEHDEDQRKKIDAKHLNFIWYTLCQNAEMMKT
jgi:hypothetical protein